MAETHRDPHRHDHLKLFPRSSWEFTKWDRVDGVGFLVCCLVTGGIIALFWALLRWAEGS
jgi:solute:Na+ symporter, SSS family